MTDVKAFSSGNVDVWWVPLSGIVNPNAPTVAEITAGVYLTPAIAWENYSLAADSSDDQDDRSLLDVGNVSSRGAAQYGGTLEFFRPKVLSDSTSDYVKAWTTFKVPRQYGYLITRVLQKTPGGRGDAVPNLPVAGQDISVYKFVADTFADNTAGDNSVKYTVTFQPQGLVYPYTKIAGATLTVTPTTLTATVSGGAKKLKAVITGVTDVGLDVSAGATWSSSDTTKASVSPHGVVKPIAAGTATITATFPGTTGTATSTVTVS